MASSRPQVHPAYLSLLTEWCATGGRDLPTWIAIFARRRKIWPAMAMWWRDVHGVPLTAWIGIEAVSPLPKVESPIRAGRRLEATHTLLGPWMAATGESYASLGRQIREPQPIPRTTVQAYDQGHLAAPRAFRQAVQKLTHNWLHAESWPNSRP